MTCRTVRWFAPGSSEAAAQIVERLRNHDPSIRVWQLGVPHGYFELDPRLLNDAEMSFVVKTLVDLLRQRTRP